MFHGCTAIIWCLDWLAFRVNFVCDQCCASLIADLPSQICLHSSLHVVVLWNLWNYCCITINIVLLHYIRKMMFDFRSEVLMILSCIWSDVPEKMVLAARMPMSSKRKGVISKIQSVLSVEYVLTGTRVTELALSIIRHFA